MRQLVEEGSDDPKNCMPVARLSCAALKHLDQALKKLHVAIDAERGDGAAAAFLTSKSEDIQRGEPWLLALCQQLRQLGVFILARMPLGLERDDVAYGIRCNCQQVPRTADDACRCQMLAS